MKKLFWIFLPLVFFSAALAGTYILVRPKVEAFVISKIEQVSRDNSPLTIVPSKIELGVFPPQVTLKNISVTPEEEIGKFLKPMKIDNLIIQIDPIQLIGGKIVLSLVKAIGGNVALDVDRLPKSDNSDFELNLQPIFRVLHDLPLRQIWLSQVNFQALSRHFQTDVKNIELYAYNGKGSLEVKLQAFENNVQIKNPAAQFDAQIKAEATLTPVTLKVDTFDLKLSNSKQVNGAFKAQGTVNIKANKKLVSDFKISTEDVHIEKFTLGSLNLQGNFNEDFLKLSEINFSHPAANGRLKETEVSFKNGIGLKAVVDIPAMDIQQLFKSLDLNVPLDLTLGTQLPCAGKVYPDISVTCSGEIHGEGLDLRQPSSKKPIVQLDKFSVNGDVTITDADVRYKANLEVMGSKGKSDGVIAFDEGFHINYEGNDVKFDSIKNLVNLKFEGSTQIKGSTEGDSHTAMATMQLDTKNFWFADHNIGNAKGQLKYEKGKLHLTNIEGTQGASRYRGELHLDLEHDTIDADADIPYAEVPDILNVFSRQVKLPMQITGSGQAKVKAWGPLEFNHLSYDLSSVVFHGTVAGESFDKVEFDVSSRGGEVHTNKALVRKNNSLITMAGTGHPDGNISVMIEGSKFRLEESENINRYSSNLFGVVDFRMSLEGYVLAPETTLKGSISQTLIEDQEMPDSNFAIRLRKNSVEGSASIIGNRVTSDFIIPYNEKSPFKLKVDTTDWDFAPFLAILGGANFQNEYTTRLSSQIDLSAEEGGFWASTGSVRIDNLVLKRGNLSLYNKEPVLVKMNKGLIHIANFNLSGEKSSVSITGDNFTGQNLNFNVNGKTDSHLIHIFVPFLEDISGPVTAALKVSGPYYRPEILGSAFVENGYVKIKGFPHAFEKIKSDVLFSHSKILINSLRGQLAGGDLNADGSLEIKGIRDIPTNIHATLTGANLNVPDGVHTSGDADLYLTGSWFPFTLSGTYHVYQAMIDKEFSDAAADASGAVKQSSYLPKVILQNNFEPIVLNINTKLEKNIRVKNSQVDGQVTGEINISGPPTSPILLGQIDSLPGTKLTSKDKVFDVTTANIKFNNPKEINPELYVSAQSRISTYDVTMVIQGTAKEPVIRLTSLPPLSEADIISLLALGTITSRLDTAASEQNSAQATMQVGAALLSSTPLTKEVKNKLGADLTFSSNFDETRNVSVLKGTLSRKITPKVTASMSRSFGDQSATDAKLTYEFNKNISAAGTWEGREATGTNTITGQQSQSTSIFGLDLEYKVEFK